MQKRNWERQRDLSDEERKMPCFKFGNVPKIPEK